MTETPAPDLMLRPWTVGDVRGLREAIDEGPDHLRPWLGWARSEPSSVEKTRQRLERWVAAHEAGTGLRFAITPVARSGHILGGANLTSRVGPDAHDVGYWVRKSATREGIAAAAVCRLLVFAFERRGVDRVVSRVDVGNDVSAAFSRRQGFVDDGEDVIAYRDGTPRPIRRFVMTRAAYEAEHRSAVHRRAARVLLEGPR